MSLCCLCSKSAWLSGALSLGTTGQKKTWARGIKEQEWVVLLTILQRGNRQGLRAMLVEIPAPRLPLAIGPSDALQVSSGQRAWPGWPTLAFAVCSHSRLLSSSSFGSDAVSGIKQGIWSFFHLLPSHLPFTLPAPCCQAREYVYKSQWAPFSLKTKDKTVLELPPENIENIFVQGDFFFFFL